MEVRLPTDKERLDVLVSVSRVLAGSLDDEPRLPAIARESPYLSLIPIVVRCEHGRARDAR